MGRRLERGIYRDAHGTIVQAVTVCACCREEFVAGPVGDRPTSAIFCAGCGKQPPKMGWQQRGRRPRAEDLLARLPRVEPRRRCVRARTAAAAERLRLETAPGACFTVRRERAGRAHGTRLGWRMPATPERRHSRAGAFASTLPITCGGGGRRTPER